MSDKPCTVNDVRAHVQYVVSAENKKLLKTMTKLLEKDAKQRNQEMKVLDTKIDNLNEILEEIKKHNIEANPIIRQIM